MATKLASGYIDLTVKYSTAMKQITDPLTKETRRAGEEAGQSMGQSMMGGLAKTAARLAPALGIGAILTKGMGRLTAIDDAEAKLRGLGKSAQQVDDIIGAVKRTVTGTSFSTAQFADAAALFTGMELEGEKLERTLKTLANTAASATGSSVGELQGIMQKIIANNGMTLETFDQLNERVAGFGPKMATAVGIPFDQLRDKITELKPSTDTVFSALESATGDTAQEMGKTFRGSFDNMMNSLAVLGAELLGPVFQAAPPVFQAMTEGVKAFASTVEPAFESAKATVSGVVDAFKSVADFVSRNSAVFGTLAAAFGGVAAVIGAALLPAFAAWLALVVKTNVMITAFLVKQTALTVGAKLAAAAQWLWNAALTANPIGIVVAAIAGLVAGLVYFFTQTETGRKVWETVWAAIKTAFTAAWNVVKTGIDALGKAVSWLWQSVFVPAFNGIKSAVENTWNFLQSAWTAIQVGIDTLGGTVTSLWQQYFVPAWEGIKGAVSTAWDFIKDIFEKFESNFKTLKSGVVSTANAIRDGIKSAFSGLAEIIKAPLRALGQVLQSVPDSVFGFSIPGAGTVKNWGATLAGLKDGGAVRDKSGKLSGPGTGRSDSILGVNAAGVPVVRVADGEGVVRADMMAKGGAAIVAALNKGWLPGFNRGGEIEDLLYGRHGEPFDANAWRIPRDSNDEYKQLLMWHHVAKGDSEGSHNRPTLPGELGYINPNFKIDTSMASVAPLPDPFMKGKEGGWYANQWTWDDVADATVQTDAEAKSRTTGTYAQRVAKSRQDPLWDWIVRSGVPGMKNGGVVGKKKFEELYGLPAGTAINYGGEGFPKWVYDLADDFGVKASTYSGHQQSQRNEPGFAPNPDNLNRGIDWSGDPEKMQALADYMASIPGMEQVIYQNPKTGKRVGVAGGSRVGDDYYASDWGGHTDHVHSRQSRPIPTRKQLEEMRKGAQGGQMVAPTQDDMAALVPVTGEAGGEMARTEGYKPSGASGGGKAGTSLFSSFLGMGAEAINGMIDQAASAAAGAAGLAATAGSFGADGGAGGMAAQMAIGMGTQAAKRGVEYGFQMAGIGIDAAAEILNPFGMPRLWSTDPMQFAPNFSTQPAAVTTAEEGMQAHKGTGAEPGPVQPGQPPYMTAPSLQDGWGSTTAAPAGLATAQPDPSNFEAGPQFHTTVNATVKDVAELDRTLTDRRRLETMRYAGRPTGG